MDEVIESVAPKLEAAIGAWRREHRLPGIVAGVASRDGLRWWHSAGFADIEAGRRGDQRTLHRVASITKTFTATAVLQLRDEGRLRLDDPAVRHLPELERLENPHGSHDDLTIRRLLMHTSGLQGELPWQDLDRFWFYPAAQIPELLHLGAVRTQPEAGYKYSNFAYELLGLLVERVAGRPFTEHVRESILDPLGMSDTTWFTNEDQAARRAVGYDARIHDDTPRRARPLEDGLFVADGGLWSTAEDLGTWIGHQLRADPARPRGGDLVLAGRTMLEMHRPTWVVDPKWEEAQGLGFYGTRKGETIVVGHAGSLHGFQSNVSFSATGKLGVVVLLNGIGSATKLAMQLMELLLPAAAEADDRREVEPFTPSPEAWRELLGAYRDPEFNDDLLVEWRNGKLIARDTDATSPDRELRPTHDPLAFLVDGGRHDAELLVFARGDDGRIDRCNLAGYPMIRVDLVREPLDPEIGTPPGAGPTASPGVIQAP
jgi:CubicO group peptidase (beta-lactamase class C family)